MCTVCDPLFVTCEVSSDDGPAFNSRLPNARPPGSGASAGSSKSAKPALLWPPTALNDPPRGEPVALGCEREHGAVGARVPSGVGRAGARLRKLGEAAVSLT